MEDRTEEQLELLDRIKDRIGFDPGQHEIAWQELEDDGAVALLVDGGGFDGGDGAFFVNEGEDLHVYGSLDPVVPGHVGCLIFDPNGGRTLRQVVPDPINARNN
jgi:hypothetical protein